VNTLAADDVVLGRRPVGCEDCGTVFLGVAGLVCPACGVGALEAAEAYALGEPERWVPDERGVAGVEEALRRAVGEVRYRTAELAVDTLVERAERSWWPLWLMDGELVATWRARAGTDYEVQSSREVLQGGVWVTEPHVDTRIDWVQRMGQLRLHFDNVPVEGLWRHGTWASRIGGLSGRGAVDLEGEVPMGVIRLPDRAPRDVRGDAVATLHRAARARLQAALGCDHVDDVTFEGPVEQEHWTWLLVPVWTTHYVDDAGEHRMLWISGVTGRVWGPRMASVRKGLLWATLWALLGLGLLAGSAVVGLVGIVLWPLLLVAAVGGVLGFLLLALALVPILTPWRHNRAQRELASALDQGR